MNIQTDRRRFLRASATGGALLGLGDLSFLSRLRPVSADEATLDPKVVRLQPEIEPLVRLLEETPRERLLEEVAARVRKGTAYRDVLAAASCWPACTACSRSPQRGPQIPRGPGRELGTPCQPRLARHRPLAADLLGARLLQEFAGARRPRGQLDDGTAGRVRPSHPPARPAKLSLRRWTEWDESAADAAVASLARSAGSNEVYEAVLPLRRPRLPLDHGHKAIYLLANSWRTLQSHRLAARRAGPAIAGLRTPDARGRQPRHARATRLTSRGNITAGASR